MANNFKNQPKHFKNFCFRLSITHNTTSPFYPCSSQAERVNRNLKISFILYHATTQNTWYTSLSWIQLALNTVVHEAQHHTPFQLIYRYPFYSPLDRAWHADDILSHDKKRKTLNWAHIHRTMTLYTRRNVTRYNKAHPLSSGPQNLFRN